MIVTLVRIKKKNETVGQMVIGDHCFETLELPWMQNKQSISCIPDGIYNFVSDWSNNKKRNVIELIGVPDRTQIQMHYAKNLSWLKGCIGLKSIEEENNVYSMLKDGGQIRIITLM